MQVKSEIRDSDISLLAERVRKRSYNKYLTGIRLVKLRGFTDCEIRFDFPVTALIGPNGAGKTTILGAAGLIYDSVPPRRFFAKSGSYDNSMRGWRIEYELIDKDRKGGPSLSRTASYLKAKWNRDAVKRAVVISGISRTLPATERKDTYKFIGGDFRGVLEENFSNEVVDAVEHILGKAAANYLKVNADRAGKNSILAVRNPDADENYSEFHFGAGEASIIRIVSSMEAAPNDSLLLVEEIENGLHPVATRRLVEYLIDVARRKSSQVIFTTHSNDALAPLPTEAVWSTYQGRLTQGKLDVAALRTLTGQVEAHTAVFTEDQFAALLAEVSLRAYCHSNNLEYAGIEIHSLGGASPARDHTRFHNSNPVRKFPAIALLDGDKRTEDGYSPHPVKGGDLESDETLPVDRDDITYGPGNGHPEAAVFEDVRAGLDTVGNMLGKLTLALQLDTPMQTRVRECIDERASTNRDIHLIFAQIGEDLDFLSESLVQRAFITTWANAFPERVAEIWHRCRGLFVLKGSA